jgi:hypothetical protein
MTLSPHKAKTPVEDPGEEPVEIDDQEGSDEESEPKKASKNKVKSEKGEGIDFVTLKVPPSMRGKGYTLLVGDFERHPIEGDVLRIEQSDWLVDHILIDSSGRVLAIERGYADSNMLLDLHPRTMRLGLMIGTATFNGNPFENIFLEDTFGTFSFNFEYQPSAFGLFLKITSISSDSESDNSHDDGIVASYRASQLRTGIDYEFVPIRKWKKFSMLAKAGGTYSWHRAEVADTSGEVSISSTDSGFGALLGMDFRYNWRNFLWTLSTSWVQQKIKFEELDFETNTVQTNIEWFGGSYAF